MGICDQSEDPDIFVACPAIPSSVYCTCPSFVTITPSSTTISGCYISNISVSLPTTTPFSTSAPLKTALNGLTQSPWVRIGFQKYCKDGNRLAGPTNETVVTTGNVSRPFSQDGDQCGAVIKAFQYSWGAIGQGNTCKVTILDERGSEFKTWVTERLLKNLSGAGKDFRGVYQMKVQWGWYITGSADGDDCGKSSSPPGEPIVGQNTSEMICSPVLWFLPNAVNVNVEGNKFTFEIEGVDLLTRSQEHMNAVTFGRSGSLKAFTDAVQELAQSSSPPFRAAFKKINDLTGNTTDMEFKKRLNNLADSITKGPLKVWETLERNVLGVYNNWLKSVRSIGGSGGVGAGIVKFFDSTFDCITQMPCSCIFNLPNFGQFIMHQNSIPTCQGDMPDAVLEKRIKAVYIINGGRCLSGDTTILTEDGWIKIQNIVKYKYAGNVACLDNNGKITWSYITNWYRNKLNNRKLIKVHLHNNDIISDGIFTEDHPILTNMGYIPIEKLDIANHKIHSGTTLFYDAFDLIKCSKLEKKTKWVYCIDVAEHHNFITHSGIVHNCSPVLSFNPNIKYNFILASRAGGTSSTVTGEKIKASAARTVCSQTGSGRGNRTGVPNPTNGIDQSANVSQQTQENVLLHTAANLITFAIEADLKVQGDPSDYYCSPIFGYGRTVGIVFINPFFLIQPSMDDSACPCWAQVGCNPKFGGEGCNTCTTTNSACNDILTNKGWFILGADHQIREGSYVTTIKLILPAPGAELNDAQPGSPGEPVHLGAWSGGQELKQGGTDACDEFYSYGSESTLLDPDTSLGCPDPVIFVGGGSQCQEQYS